MQKFNSSGIFLTKWGSFGSGDGQFDVPVGIAIDNSDNVYVADHEGNRIQKFDSSGVFITSWTGIKVRIESIISDLDAIVLGNPDTPLGDKVEDALAKAQVALDELTKTPPDNQAVVGSLEGVVGDLEAVVSDGLLDPTQGTQLMDELAGIARKLASDAVDQAAIAGAGDPDSIADAQQALADGDVLGVSEAFKDAISKYKDALAKAESALP